MTRTGSPWKLVALGLLLLLAGAVLPFLMVIRLLEPGFALSFLAYAASLGGLILGLSGIVRYRSTRRREPDHEGGDEEGPPWG